MKDLKDTLEVQENAFKVLEIDTQGYFHSHLYLLLVLVSSRVVLILEGYSWPNIHPR